MKSASRYNMKSDIKRENTQQNSCHSLTYRAVGVANFKNSLQITGMLKCNKPNIA